MILVNPEKLRYGKGLIGIQKSAAPGKIWILKLSNAIQLCNIFLNLVARKDRRAIYQITYLFLKQTRLYMNGMPLFRQLFCLHRSFKR
jgi:hypothetical protein